MSTAPLTIWASNDRDLFAVEDTSTVTVRRRGYRRHWRIAARAGQLVTLTPRRGPAVDPPVVVHADELLLVAVDD